MTTIAYADGILASDSQATSGSSVIQTSFQKIFTPAEGKRWSIYGKRILAIAVCGEAAGIYELQAQLEKGIMFETKGKQDAWTSCIAVADDKSFFVLDGYGDRKNALFNLFPAMAKFAMGSGGDAANAYLAIGKKAVDAVKQAIKLDVYSGGEVQTWEFPEVVPEDIKPAEVSATQQGLIDKVTAEIQAIGKSAIEKATAEIIEKTTEAAKADTKKDKAAA